MDVHRIVFILTFCYLCWGALTRAFLLDDSCVVKQPCTCAESRIDCSNRSLSSLPTFLKPSSQWYFVLLYLPDNHITKIPDDAFAAFGHTDTRNIHIALGSNDITNIQPHAFRGIENSVQYLNLDNNRLDHLPVALKTLNNLHFLHMQGNPIVTINPLVTGSIGDTLTGFFFSAEFLTGWPAGVSSLSSVGQLTVDKIKMDALPSTAFIGMIQDLHTLELDATTLKTIPTAICSLTHLSVFEFNNNTNLNQSDVGVGLGCSVNNVHPYLLSVTLSGNNLKRFPRILFEVPTIETLTVINNPGLSLIRQSDIPSNSTLRGLILTGNSFTEVPQAVNVLNKLQTLDLSQNKLAALQHHALQLPQLSRLFLTDNPLTSIDHSAFDSLPHLREIHLGGTGLISVPRALETLSTLRLLWLPDNLNCTCDLKWMLAWQPMPWIRTGTCQSSGLPLSTYVTSTLKNC